MFVDVVAESTSRSSSLSVLLLLLPESTAADAPKTSMDGSEFERLSTDDVDDDDRLEEDDESPPKEVSQHGGGMTAVFVGDCMTTRD